MTDLALEKLKYPIGPFQWVDRLSPEGQVYTKK